jgi:hypothetical protein
VIVALRNFAAMFRMFLFRRLFVSLVSRANDNSRKMDRVWSFSSCRPGNHFRPSRAPQLVNTGL